MLFYGTSAKVTTEDINAGTRWLIETFGAYARAKTPVLIAATRDFLNSAAQGMPVYADEEYPEKEIAVPYQAAIGQQLRQSATKILSILPAKKPEADDNYGDVPHFSFANSATDDEVQGDASLLGITDLPKENPPAPSPQLFLYAVERAARLTP